MRLVRYLCVLCIVSVSIGMYGFCDCLVEAGIIDKLQREVLAPMMKEDGAEGGDTTDQSSDSTDDKDGGEDTKDDREDSGEDKGTLTGHKDSISTTDEHGNTVTVIQKPDGSFTKITKDPDGNPIVTEDDEASLSGEDSGEDGDTGIWHDDTISITDEQGNTVTIIRGPDGSLTKTAKDPDGNPIDTGDKDVSLFGEDSGEGGGTLTWHDDSISTTDEHGNTVTVTQGDGGSWIKTTTDPEGNTIKTEQSQVIVDSEQEEGEPSEQDAKGELLGLLDKEIERQKKLDEAYWESKIEQEESLGEFMEAERAKQEAIGEGVRKELELQEAIEEAERKEAEYQKASAEYTDHLKKAQERLRAAEKRFIAVLNPIDKTEKN